MSRVPLRGDAIKPLRDVRHREGEVYREGRPPVRYCEEVGCEAATFLRKPFCPEHLLRHAYAARLVALDAAAVAAREIEEAKAERLNRPRKRRPSRARGAKP